MFSMNETIADRNYDEENKLYNYLSCLVHGIPRLEIELASKRTWPIVNVYLTIDRLTL